MLNVPNTWQVYSGLLPPTLICIYVTWFYKKEADPPNSDCANGFIPTVSVIQVLTKASACKLSRNHTCEQEAGISNPI